MEKNNIILSLIIAVLAFFLLRSCDEAEEIKEVIKIEYLKGKSDTILIDRIKVVYKDRAPKELPQEVEEKTGDTLRVFKTNFSDSLAEIVITSRVKGQLIGSDILFKPKFPKYILRVDTIKESHVLNKYELYIGGQVGHQTFQPAIMLRTKKNLVISAGYDFVGENWAVGVYTRIKKRH